jgi:hypothetical protein
MSNTPNVNRDAGFAKQPAFKQTKSRPPGGGRPRKVKLATRDPRRKGG